MQKREIINSGYALLVLSLGIVLFLTALPRVRASFNHLPVDRVIADLYSQDLDPQKLENLITTAQQSIVLYDHPRYWADLSQLLFFQAEKNHYSKLKQQSLLKQAQSSAKQALARSPANSLLWFQLARLDVLLNTVSNQTVKALNLSIMTGPYEFGHLLPRLQLCLALLYKFDLKEPFLLQSQILIAWQRAPTLFIKEIAIKNDNMNKIRFLLQNNSVDVLAVMETEIEKAH